MRHTTRGPEPLPASALHVIHPACGAVLMITGLEVEDDTLHVVGICYRCDRYVELDYRTRLTPSVELNLERLQERAVREAMARAIGVRAAAKLLGVRHATLYSLMRRYGIPLPFPNKTGWTRGRKKRTT